MRLHSVQVGAVVIGLGAILFTPSTATSGISPHGASAPPPGPTAKRPLSGKSAATLSAAQLDQLLAPIDLYSDRLLWQIFLAATHTRDVIEAARWLQDPKHAQLNGGELTR